MSEEEIIAMQKKFVKAMGGAWLEHTDTKRAPRSGAREKGLPGRLAETLQAARDGKSLPEVAKARTLTGSTIVKHLEELALIGKLIRADFAHLVPLDVVDEIHEALVAENSDRLSPVFHALKCHHSFETIRLVRLMKLN